MYSEQLEQLIQSVIADGVITDKERAVLRKKAVAEGVDEDEIDVYVDGLLAQKGGASIASSAKRDLDFLEKVIGESIYYQMKNPVRLNASSKYIDRLFINLIYVESHYWHEDHPEYDNSVGIRFFGFGKSIRFMKNVILQATTSKLTLSKALYYDDRIGSTTIKGKQVDFVETFMIDTEILQQLCKEGSLRITFPEIEYTTEYIRDTLTEQIKDAYPQQDFASFAQVFYRSAIDNTAYPDATIKEGGEEQVVIPTDENETIARLLCMNPKNLVPIDTDVPCYKQFRDPNSKITIYHIDDSKKLNGEYQGLNMTLQYQFTLYLHAIAKDNEKPQFFFELTCSGGQTTEKDGKRSRKIPFGLVPGDIFLTIGINEYFINALTENTRAMEEQLGRMIKADEHCFYPIKDSVMQQLIQANTFEIVARNEIGNSGRLKPILGNLSMQKKWILSYNILTYPEQKEQLLQEYDDSKVSTKLIKGIKGLFGKK